MEFVDSIYVWLEIELTNCISDTLRRLDSILFSCFNISLGFSEVISYSLMIFPCIIVSETSKKGTFRWLLLSRYFLHMQSA
ncbi:hypothetical protein LWI29_009526 [Acer saccharum]|uniref:Uncharacterized protein n=1 Tax=Acer saccharum TaxID=4024 RepID=A0AA39RVL5_ACESA|nr:hypothetical protein LWI29_009526 [Acer saccharum]